ncbi:MAG: hypothetical protein V4722_22400 [Bacteroidota bacterium]
MKKLIIWGLALIAGQNGHAQRIGIGTTNPMARLSVDSGIMIDQSNRHDGILSTGALMFGSDGKVGIGRSTLVGTAARSGIGLYTNSIRRLVVDSVGKVGIGTSTPVQQLHVSGNIYTPFNIGIGVADPLYRLHVSGDSYFETSNVGINIAPNTSYALYASGIVRFTGDFRLDGILNPNNTLTIGNNTTIDGSLTVGGRGIVRGSGGSQWRLVRITAGFQGTVAGNSDIVSPTVTYDLGGGTIAGILVGPVTETGTGSSNLGSVGLVAIDLNNTSCNFIITNASSTAAELGTLANPTRWQLTILVYD